jgi:hypothetical protein
MVESSISWVSFKMGSFAKDEILKTNIAEAYRNEKGGDCPPPCKVEAKIRCHSKG